MPFEIHGWVETTRFDGRDRDEPHAWAATINLSPLLDVADEVSETLFGLSKRVVAGEVRVAALAAGRGLPENPSSAVREEVEALPAHPSSGGFTHALWEEIQAVDLGPALAESDWAVVFRLVETLLEDHRFSGDRIRIVVWYDW